jgi:GNAT superfamily N-acetyltransferase
MRTPSSPALDELSIEPIRVEEADGVARRMPWRPASRHVERAIGQRTGRAVYLLAWEEGAPVGHSFVKWPGELTSRQARTEGCVEVEDLYVVPEARERGIGGALLEASEACARRAGYTRIGLAVALENDRARRLYAHHGYRDAGHGVFTLRWTSLDDEGLEQTWREQCTYLVKDLL